MSPHNTSRHNITQHNPTQLNTTPHNPTHSTHLVQIGFGQGERWGTEIYGGCLGVSSPSWFQPCSGSARCPSPALHLHNFKTVDSGSYIIQVPTTLVLFLF